MSELLKELHRIVNEAIRAAEPGEDRRESELFDLIAPLERWTEKEQTQAEVEVFILDQLFGVLPTPPFTPDDKHALAKRVDQHIWQQSANPGGALAA